MAEKYILIFSGLSSDDASEINQFINEAADKLGYSKESVQNLIKNAPIKIMESTDKSELLPFYEFFGSSIANVSLKSEDSKTTGSNSSNEIEFDFDFEETAEANIAEPAPAKADKYKPTNEASEPNREKSESLEFSFETSESAEDQSSQSDSDTNSLKEETEQETESNSKQEIFNELEFSFDEPESARAETPEEVSESLEPPTEDFSNAMEFDLDQEDSGNQTQVITDLNQAKKEAIKQTESDSTNATELSFEEETAEASEPIFENTDKTESAEVTPNKSSSESGDTENTNKTDKSSDQTDQEQNFANGTAIKLEESSTNIISLSKHKSSIKDLKNQLTPAAIVQVGIPVIIASLLLIIGNIIIFSPKHETSSAQTLTVDSTDENTKSNVQTVTAKKYQGSNEIDNVRISAEVNSYNQEITNISMTITPPEAPLLTPEEIILNKERKPWLDPILLNGIQPKLDKSGKSYIGLTKTRVFINHKGEKKRVIMPIAIRAIKKDDNLIKLAVIVKYGYNKSPEDSYKIQAADNGKINFFIKGIVDVTPVE